MEKDDNINQQESTDIIDFDSLFNEEDIKTWGSQYLGDSEFIAGQTIDSGVK